MLKIRKDDVEMIVTQGAYENLYESMGFEIVNEKKAVSKFEMPSEPAKVDKVEEQHDEKPKKGNK